MTKLSDLPTVDRQPRKAVPKPRPEVLDKFADKREQAKKDREFRATVWKLDDGKCRACGRKCVKCLEAVPNRGEVHHLGGRRGDRRCDVTRAVLLCLFHHASLKDANGLRQVGSTRYTVQFVWESKR